MGSSVGKKHITEVHKQLYNLLESPPLVLPTFFIQKEQESSHFFITVLVCVMSRPLFMSFAGNIVLKFAIEKS